VIIIISHHRDQLLSLVDSHKQMVLQEVVCGLNPNAAAGGPILRSLAARFYLGFTSVFYLSYLALASLFPSIAPQCVLALTSFLPHFPRVCPTLALFFGLC
jgi:hypothetical protein